MLSAVSGGEVIQDVPACFAENALDDNYDYPNQKACPIPDGRLEKHSSSPDGWISALFDLQKP